MSIRATSLQNLSAIAAIDRTIGSKYDVIKSVSEKLTEIETLGNSEIVGLTSAQLIALSELTGVDVVSTITAEIGVVAGSDLVNLTTAQWNSILDVQTAADSINNLTVTAVTNTAGTEATATLVGNVLTLGIPRGINGTAGLTPVITFTVDENYNLSYDITYSDVGGSETAIEEW